MAQFQCLKLMCVCLCRSPPRPSPGGLHYSDEDICNNYNGAVLTESTTLTEKPTEVSESEVALALYLSLRFSLSIVIVVILHCPLNTPQPRLAGLYSSSLQDVPHSHVNSLLLHSKLKQKCQSHTHISTNNPKNTHGKSHCYFCGFYLL